MAMGGAVTSKMARAPVCLSTSRFRIDLIICLMPKKGSLAFITIGATTASEIQLSQR